MLQGPTTCSWANIPVGETCQYFTCSDLLYVALVERVITALKTEFDQEAHVSGPEPEDNRQFFAVLRLTVLQEFVGINQDEYLYLASLVHEWSRGLMRTPR
jgi:hypothetical protein